MDYNTAFPISKISFKPDELVQISRIIFSVKEYLSKIGLDNFLETPDFEKLNHVPKIKLEEIRRWDKIVKHLSVISYRIEITKEFKILKELITHSKEKVTAMNSEIIILEDRLKIKYSENIAKSLFFSNLFTYQQFKIAFDETVESFSKSQIEQVKKNDIFTLLRKKIIGDQIHIEKRIVNRDTIHINEIKDNKSLFELLSSEFLVQICDTMGFNVPYGKKSFSEVVKPSHVLAKKLKLKHTEVAFITISLHPLGDSELLVGDQVHLQNLTFDVTKAQQVVEREMFHSISFDNINNCNLIVPIYFSFIKGNLIKDQRI